MREPFHQADGKRVFNRRTFLIGGLQGLLVSGLAGKLIYLALKDSSRYRTLADENRIRLEIILPERGLILDRKNQVLATNQPHYRLTLLPNFKGDLYKLLTEVELLVSFKENIPELIEEIKRTSSSTPFTIAPIATWDDVCKIELNTVHHPELFINKGAQRFYPHSEMTAHLVGYVQAPTDNDDVDKNLIHLADFRLGKAGIEKKYDHLLQGQAGYKEIEVNAKRKVVRELKVYPSQKGQSLSLTIDLRLQSFITERLREYPSAAVTVMDVHTGEIYALVSSPSFDPNLFTNGIRTKDWQNLVNNAYGVMNNKAINGQYSPGSTFKMIVGLAGLESQRITSQYRVHCPGFIEQNGHRYHCHQGKYGHGYVNITSALKMSCDVYFYEIAKIIGHDNIGTMARRFGLGEKTGIKLPSEKRGLVPDRAWKFMRYRRNWTMGDTILMSIGQGYMLSTPLQLAVMTARLVNGGYAVTPQLIRDQPLQNYSSIDIKAAYLNLILEGMNQAVNQPQGTAYTARIERPGYEMGGKTGTTQVRRITMKERQQRVLRNDELPWQERDHALFVGYAPLHKPRFAISVLVEHGGTGGKVSAKIGHDVMVYVQELDL